MMELISTYANLQYPPTEIAHSIFKKKNLTQMQLLAKALARPSTAIDQLPIIPNIDISHHFAKETKSSVMDLFHNLAIRNILATKDRQSIVLCDFKSLYGSNACPEICSAIFQNLPDTERPYSTKSDVFCFGTTIADFILYNNIRTPWQYHSGGFIPPPTFRSIVEACIRRDPADRPSMLDVKAMLEASLNQDFALSMRRVAGGRCEGRGRNWVYRGLQMILSSFQHNTQFYSDLDLYYEVLVEKGQTA
ncbi:hypothetical protein DFJ43DRAFT_1168293 [Lentinula guzmanii]|uniref:Protein kinase domain-containing protein n=1 Tax=Lentinula guzmanii TaxID=2804957 RepID=A0AA38JM54_9AGAR|nr:hypothetical protein DFJ43DRAFT_1168293 [Lentinula guzmanii]